MKTGFFHAENSSARALVASASTEITHSTQGRNTNTILISDHFYSTLMIITIHVKWQESGCTSVAYSCAQHPFGSGLEEKR